MSRSASLDIFMEVLKKGCETLGIVVYTVFIKLIIENNTGIVILSNLLGPINVISQLFTKQSIWRTEN